MVIDAHQHFWHFDPVRDSWISEKDMQVLRRDFMPEELAEVLAAEKIDGCVAVQADQSERETAFLLELARRNPFIKAVIGWTDLRSPDLERRLDEYAASSPCLKGFRHIVQAEPDPDFLLQPAFIRGLKSLAARGFTYDLLIYPHQLPAADALMQQVEPLAVVLDHMAKPCIRNSEILPWKHQLAGLASHAGLYCKVSGIITEADWQNWQPQELYPYLDVVMDVFGPDRLMFGSDWPVCLLAGSYSRVKELLAWYLDSRGMARHEGIWGGNACRFYGIQDRSAAI